MMRAIVLLAVVGVAQAASVKAAPLVAKRVNGHVQLTVEQQKMMHSGCATACSPSPVESKCVTSCETEWYRCIDETGPNENEEDTKKCQDEVLAKFTETKGVEKEEKNATKGEEKKEEKKAKMFLQVGDVDDSDDTTQSGDVSDEETGDEQQASEQEEDATQAEEEDQEAETQVGEEVTAHVEKGVATDDSETEEATEDNSEAEAEADTEDSFVQVHKKDIDDDDTEAEDLAKMEDQSDKEEGEDDDDSTGMGEEDQSTTEEDSFIQTQQSHKSEWKPEPCDELEPGVPCTHLYEHPQGSQVVMPCPVDKQTNPESCNALFGSKADGEQCSQITCPKALGVTMKLVCGGGCCPSCWAPDHVLALDRHTSVDDAAVVPAAPQAAGTCAGVK